MSNGPDDLLPGTVLQHRYVIQYRAAGGGMGTVYNAIDRHVAGRVVAVKEMKQADRDGKKLVGEELEKARKRFEREAATLSSLQHDRIPRVYDFFESQQQSYLVMDWIDGETLVERLQHMRGAMPVQLVLAYALQLCEALTYLHHRYEPIIFRDLKPSNIMVRPDGHVFLIDFGIARSFKPGQKDDTEKFRVRGFGAPELGFAQTDERTDLFSLGATMHYCLTRQMPDYIEDNKPFPSIRSYNSNVPVELDALILEMVQYNPNDRPPNIVEIKQQFEQMYREIAANQAGNAQTSTISPMQYDPAFYADETERGNEDETVRPRQIVPPRQPYVPSLPPTTPASLSPLEIVLGLLSSGWQQIARPFVAKARGAGAVMFSTDVRYRYLVIQARLNATGLWTTRFLLFLLGMLVGSIVLSVFVYTRLGASYYRSEFALAFVLLIVALVTGGRLRNLAARHIMLGAGWLIGAAFLLLLISPGFQSSSQEVGAAGQATTLNLLLTYGVVTLVLIALIGSMGSGSLPAQAQDFARFGRLAMVGVAGICFLMQYSFGELEQVIFLPSSAYPFAVTISSSPRITTNAIVLAVLGCIALFSLLRVGQPFGRFSRFVLLLLCLAFLPVQFTFGLSRLGLAFPQLPQASLVLLNLVIFIAPLLLALLVFPAIPQRIAWLVYVPLLALSLGVAFMQASLGNIEPFPFLSSQPQAQGDFLTTIAPFGQLVIYSLLAAGALLFFRSIVALFARRAASSTYQTSTTIAIKPIKLPGAGDRLALTVVALGCGIVQWSFWSGALQRALAFTPAQQDATLLYAPYLGLIFTFVTISSAVLAMLSIVAHALFFPEREYAWMKTLLIALDRVTTLSLVGITCMLLVIFGARGGWLANSIDTAKVFGGTVSPPPQTHIAYYLLAIGLLALCTLISLFRLMRPFGWIERVLVLICCVATLLMFSDTPDVQALPLLSTQQVTGIVSSLSTNRSVALFLLLSTVLSLLWLLRTKIASDRIVLGLILLCATFLAGLHALAPHHMLFLLAMLLEIQGLLIAFKIERVRNGI